MGKPISLYLDENVPVVVAEQLKLRDIDVVTVRDLGLLGDNDFNHLTRATEMKRVLCTYYRDYLWLATSGIAHTGVVIGKHGQRIGDWVKGLELICSTLSAEDMNNRVEYLP